MQLLYGSARRIIFLGKQFCPKLLISSYRPGKEFFRMKAMCSINIKTRLEVCTKKLVHVWNDSKGLHMEDGIVPMTFELLKWPNFITIMIGQYLIDTNIWETKASSLHSSTSRELRLMLYKRPSVSYRRVKHRINATKRSILSQKIVSRERRRDFVVKSPL